MKKMKKMKKMEEMKKENKNYLLTLINIPEITLQECICNSSDVEILNKIQDLMLETSSYWDNGIPKFDEYMKCDCRVIEAKKELLTLLLIEYQRRMYKDCPFRMHLSEK